MLRKLLPGGLGLGGMLLITTAASAELPPAVWNESIDLRVGSTLHQWWGTDPNLPESKTEVLSQDASELTGVLSYDSIGPQIVAHQEAHGPYCVGSARSTLGFEFQMVETHKPPVYVSYVPLTVAAIGTMSASGKYCADDFLCDFPSAMVDVSVTRSETTVLNTHGFIDGGTETTTKSTFVTAHAWRVYAVSMIAQAQSRTSSEPVTATAAVQLQVTISSDLIPGTDSKFTDYYEIEYSPGYWALGNPTPVKPTTWGKIKSFYLNP